VIDALQKAERALRNSNRANLVSGALRANLDENHQAQGIVGHHPDVTRANWFRVGTMLATKLEEAGQVAQADTVREHARQPRARSPAPPALVQTP